MFTTPVWDFVLCTLYCNVGEDGNFSQSDFNNIMAKLDTHFTGNLALTFSGVLRGWQLIGLNNAARIPSTSNLDCSACNCAGCASLFDIGTGFIAGGIVIDRDDTSITVQSTIVGGSRSQIGITTGNKDICCTANLPELISGTYGDLVDWIACGDDIGPGNIHFGMVGPECINTMLMFQDNGVIFTMKITMADC
jgi:hypothetical protein